MVGLVILVARIRSGPSLTALFFVSCLASLSIAPWLGCSGDNGGNGSNDNGNDGEDLPPALGLWQAAPAVTTIGGPSVSLTLPARDPEGGEISAQWTAEGGRIEDLGIEAGDQGLQYLHARWYPEELEIGRTYKVRCVVRDAGGQESPGEIPALVNEDRYIVLGEPPFGNHTRSFSPGALAFDDATLTQSTALAITPETAGQETYVPWLVRQNSVPTWIGSVLPAYGANSSTITVAVDAESLVEGMDTSAEILVDFVANDSTTTEALTVTIKTAITPPALSVDTTSLAFAPGEIEKSFNVTNTGGGSLSWTCGAVENWLSVNPATADNDGTVTVRLNTTRLTAGSTQGTVQVTSNGGDATVGVQVTPPELSVSPSLLVFGEEEEQKTFSIANTGGYTLNWTCTASENWISVSPESGSNDETITVTVNTLNLVEGTYPAQVTVSSNGGNAIIDLQVTVAKGSVGIIVGQVGPRRGDVG